MKICEQFLNEFTKKKDFEFFSKSILLFVERKVNKFECFWFDKCCIIRDATEGAAYILQ